jgi:uncharacterized protein (DUF1697 family)
MGMHVALLRGINVGGGRKVPMAELRHVAEGLGLKQVRTFIASGNLLFESEALLADLETKLEAAVERHFGFPVDIMVRTAEAWSAAIAANPFGQEAEATPKFLYLFSGKQANADEALAWLSARAAPEEKIAGSGASIYIYFGAGAGRSKLGAGPKPGLWTGRNWRTVLTLKEMLCNPSP